VESAATRRLTREWNITSTRSEADAKVVDRVTAVAAAGGISRAQVKLTLLRSEPVIVAPIIGATSLRHLDHAIASVAVKLPDDEIACIEEPYVPHAVVGFASAVSGPAGAPLLTAILCRHDPRKGHWGVTGA
jgi:1-deoxyxylulose-5-phosphate synthase